MINGNYVLPVLKAVWLKKVMPLVSYKKIIVLVNSGQFKQVLCN